MRPEKYEKSIVPKSFKIKCWDIMGNKVAELVLYHLNHGDVIYDPAYNDSFHVEL